MEIVISDTCKTKIFAYILFLFMSAFGTTILSLQYRDQGARLRVGGNYKGKHSRGGGEGWGVGFSGQSLFQKILKFARLPDEGRNAYKTIIL